MRLLHRISPHRKHGFPGHRRDPWGTANTGTVRGAAWAGCPAPGAQAVAPAWWAPPDRAQLTGRRAPARGVGSLVPGATWSLWASWSRVPSCGSWPPRSRTRPPRRRRACPSGSTALRAEQWPSAQEACAWGLLPGERTEVDRDAHVQRRVWGSGGPMPLPPPPTSPAQVPGAPGSFGGSAPSAEEGVHADAEVTGPVPQPEVAVSCGRRTRRPRSRRT